MGKFESIKSDNRLNRAEIQEVKEIAKDKDKLKVLLETNADFKNFINTDFRWASSNSLRKNKRSVKDLQNKLGFKGKDVDGIFGRQTFGAVIEFQKANGLIVDGFAGDFTQKKLFGEKVASKKKGEKINNNELKLSEKKAKLEKYANNIAVQHGIPRDVFINLINNENVRWDPNLGNKSSGAYGLTQIIPETWDRFSKGLNINNPKNQMIVGARYLSYIKKENNCDWIEAIAFYNTGENFNNKSNRPVKKSYIAGNLKSIAWKVPGCNGKTPEELYGKISKKQYFEAAKEYYA